MAYYAKEIHFPELGLTLYPKIETIMTHMLKEIEKYWDSKIS